MAIATGIPPYELGRDPAMLETIIHVMNEQARKARQRR